MRKPILISRALAMALVTCLILFNQAFAMNRPELIQEYKDQAAASYTKMLELQEFLHLSQPAWTDVEQEEYLFHAFWTIYNGLLAYRMENDHLPVNLHDVVTANYAPGWPLNPYDNWAEMGISDSVDGFAPGCFVLQTCPSDYYSYSGPVASQILIPLSFELGIYGPAIEFARLGDPQVMEFNDWASVIEGTLYQAGSHRETAKVTDRKRDKRRKQAEENSSENASNAGQGDGEVK
jgi:hypothetical protein